MQRYLILLIMTLLISCSGKNENLIKFDSGYSRELTDDEFYNRNYSPTNIKTSNSNDYIDFDVELFQAGCMNFDGDIEIKADTLKLNYWNTTDDVCDEMVVYKLNYRVKRPYAENLPVELVRK